MHLALILLTLLLAVSGVTKAEDPCAGFDWNVAAERALFAGTPNPLAAGKSTSRAPSVEVGRAYSLALALQSEVQFAVPPARSHGAEAARAGLATVRIGTAGRYRFSLDAPAWLDVVVAGSAVPANDFRGSHGCNAPHKIVEFELPAGESLIEVSSSPSSPLRLAITPTPCNAR